MQIDVARHVLRAAFRSARELQELIPILRDSCDDAEYEALAKGIAAAVAEIVLKVQNHVLAAHPELEGEVEADLERYGRYF